jgi:hypothetical protein
MLISENPENIVLSVIKKKSVTTAFHTLAFDGFPDESVRSFLQVTLNVGQYPVTKKSKFIR